jgi:hypothetical protein
MESNSNFRCSESAESRSPTPTLQSQSQPDAEKEIGEKISQLALVPGPPEGGLHAWLTIFGASLVSFATFGFVVQLLFDRLAHRLIPIPFCQNRKCVRRIQ